MAGSFSVPKVAMGDGVVRTMETALANKIGKAAGPKSTPKGWSMGKKTGWNGGAKPPGLLKQMTGSTPSPVPVDPPRGTGTKRIGKPPEFTS